MSRTDSRSTALRHRPSRTVAASIVATVLLALGVGLVWVTVLQISQGSWPGFVTSTGRWLGKTTWGNTGAIAISITLAVIGLVLLVAALAPGRPNAIRVSGSDGASHDSTTDTDFVMTRRSVAKLAAAHADLIDGVDSVSATASTSRVDLQVTTASDQRAEVEQMVVDRVRAALVSAGLQPTPRVSASVRTR